jgi:hypothetical protein
MRKKSLFILWTFVITALISLNPDLTWSSTTIYGPKKFTRSAGKPITVKEIFFAPSPTANYKLIVLNGEKDQNRVSSAKLKVNETEILKESDFNQQVDRIERSIKLKASNTISVELKSAPESFIHIMIECLDCLDITISSPSYGTTVNTSFIIVKGTILAINNDVGVIVNGIPAALSGNHWAVYLPINEGSNTITAKITDFYGNYTQKSVSINAIPIPESMTFSAYPETGVAPLSVTFSLSTSINPSPASYQIDFEGDGMIDVTIPTIENLTHIYPGEGIYFPTVIAMDSQGNTHSTNTMVHVLNKTEMDGLLKGKWEGMKQALGQRNINEALNYFIMTSREEYNEIFELLVTQLPNLISAMTEINLIELTGNTAEYYIKRSQRGEEISYFIYFVKDEKGLWKISSF